MMDRNNKQTYYRRLALASQPPKGGAAARGRQSLEGSGQQLARWLVLFLFTLTFAEGMAMPSLSPLLATPQDSTNCDGCRQIGLPDWQLMTDQCVVWSPSVGLEDPISPYTRACVNITTDYTLTIISDEGALLVQDTFRVERGELYVSLSADQEEPNICTADSIVLVSIVTSDTDYSLQWSTGDTLPIIEVRESGRYSLTVTNANGCSVADTIEVKNQDATPIDIVSSDPDGQLQCGEIAQLSVPVETRPALSPTYRWSTGGTTPNITITEPGDYALSVTTANGCTQTGQISVAGEAPPEVSIQSSQSSICPGDPLVTLMAKTSATGDYTIHWSNGRTGSQINVDLASTYSVTVSTAAGCSTTATFELLDCEGTQRCNVEAPVDSFFCGALDSTVLSSQSTISSLQSSDRFMAGDFLVEVTSARGTGTFNGTGIIEVPYLQGARLSVDIVNARINTDCQLIEGFVEVEGGGLKLLSDEMISALDDVLDALETIDDVLERAEDIVDAIDQAIAFAEPYLPDGVLDSLLQAQEDLIKAKQAYEDAQASGDQAAIDAAKDALKAAKDALKDAQKAYVEATTEFFKDFLKVVVAIVKDLLKDCVLTDRKQLYEEAYTTFDDEIETLNSAISLPAGANESDGTSVSAMYSEYGIYEITDVSIPDLDAKADTFYNREIEYLLCLTIDKLSVELTSPEDVQELSEQLKEVGFDLMEKVGARIKNGETTDAIVLALKEDMADSLEILLKKINYPE